MGGGGFCVLVNEAKKSSRCRWQPSWLFLIGCRGSEGGAGDAGGGGGGGSPPDMQSPSVAESVDMVWHTSRLRLQAEPMSWMDRNMPTSAERTPGRL